MCGRDSRAHAVSLRSRKYIREETLSLLKRFQDHKPELKRRLGKIGRHPLPNLSADTVATRRNPISWHSMEDGRWGIGSEPSAVIMLVCHYQEQGLLQTCLGSSGEHGDNVYTILGCVSPGHFVLSRTRGARKHH